MKDSVRKLELKKLIQEYSFLLTDEVYKKEVINENQTDFLKAIHEKKIELGQIEDKPYQPENSEEKVNNEDSESSKGSDVDEDNVSENVEKNEDDENSEEQQGEQEGGGEDKKQKKSPKIKKLYREIVKNTHPDKTNSNEHVESYNRARSAYEKNDLIELYFVAISLDIDVELDENDLLNINETISSKRRELHNLEQSYLWLWYNAKTKEQRDMVVNLFINKSNK
jgi:hypothetical protein